MRDMPYKIQYSTMDAVYMETTSRISQWNSNLKAIEQKADNIINLESFSGKTADNVKSYLREVYSVINMGLTQILIDFTSKYLLYKNGYYNIDSNIYSVMTASTMSWYNEKANELKYDQYYLQSSVSDAISDISDIFQLYTPSSDRLISGFDGIMQTTERLSEEIDAYEMAAVQGDLNDLRSLIINVYLVVSDYYRMSHRITNYKSGDFLTNLAVLDMARSVIISQNFVSDNQVEIINADNRQHDVCQQMKADYEEACEAAAKVRADQGGVKIIQGAVATGIGAACIILTAGAATPIVIAAGISATCSIAYGVSKGIEGTQDVVYGMNGNSTTPSFNFIRDTIFNGNSKYYELWGNISMTVSSLLIPAGKILDGAIKGGATGLELAKTTFFTAGKEITTDIAADAFSEKLTEVLQNSFGWSDTLTALVNVGLSFVTEKGIEKGIDIGFNKIQSNTSFQSQMYSGDQARYEKWVTENTGFAGEMNFEDSARYNKWVSDCEAGIHNNHPGLSKLDMELWNISDRHIAKEISFNKVHSSYTDSVRDMKIEQVNIENSLPSDSFTDLQKVSAQDVNQWYKVQMDYDNPPYKPDAEAYQLKLTQDTDFVRVYDGKTSRRQGGWLTRPEDIEGLTPEQIRNKFALPDTPKYVTHVTVPEGTIIRGGIVNEVPGWGEGGGLQFDLRGLRLDSRRFKPGKPLR